jgi:hypothetical protein
MKTEKCIIDNWSLEHAGFLLDDSTDLSTSTMDELVRNMGGLSNFISSILLYPEPHFIINGFEKDWKRFNWFDTNASAFIKGFELDELSINWNSTSAYEHKGVHNYIFTSRYFGSDLLICPERSGEAILIAQNPASEFFETLKLIDKKINRELSESAFSKIQLGIERNFQFPALTQYVLSEASNRSDLLTVIMQLKSDGKIQRIIQQIEERTSSTKSAGKFEKDIENLVKEAFGRPIIDDKSWSVQVSAYFVSVSKSINRTFFKRSENLVFLRNIVACRSEAFKAQNNFQRIFKRKLQF